MREEAQALNKHLERKGLKKSRQREVVLDVFLKSRGHVTIEELHRSVQRKDPTIGLTTVYRAMKLFCECNLARANHFQEGQVRYEQQFKSAHHDHLICVHCGQTVEFMDDEIERLQGKIAERYGFRMTHHRMEMFGLCRKCRRTRSSNV